MIVSVGVDERKVNTRPVSSESKTAVRFVFCGSYPFPLASRLVPGWRTCNVLLRHRQL